MKKGFTLIEIIVTMSIIAIVSSITILSLRNTYKIRNSLDVEITKRGILNIILNSKNYCYINKVSGHLKFDAKNEEISFYDDSRNISEQMSIFTLPKGIDLEYSKDCVNEVNIGREGGLGEACTISFKDSYNNYYTVTICVGSFSVDVK